MNRFNLSEWAIRHRSLVTYFMLVIVIAGVASYLRLGRSEDPDFTVKTMVVQVGWPGANVGDTIEQITDRLERKLQETPNLDYLKSYTTAGKATIFVYLKDSTPPAQVPDIWYQVRKKVGDIRNTLPQDIVGPGFNDEFGDTYGIVYGFTADGFTHRELRDQTTSRKFASSFSKYRTSRRSTCSGRRTSASTSSSRPSSWRDSGSTAPR
jgi:multidrug efflux pump subunit AcrB